MICGLLGYKPQPICQHAVFISIFLTTRKKKTKNNPVPQKSKQTKHFNGEREGRRLHLRRCCLCASGLDHLDAKGFFHQTRRMEVEQPPVRALVASLVSHT